MTNTPANGSDDKAREAFEQYMNKKYSNEQHNDWHSMNTAPKNGREILLFLDVGPHHYQHRVVGSWSDQQECFIDWCNEPIELNMSNRITGWTELPAPPTFEGAPQ